MISKLAAEILADYRHHTVILAPHVMETGDEIESLSPNTLSISHPVSPRDLQATRSSDSFGVSSLHWSCGCPP